MVLVLGALGVVGIDEGAVEPDVSASKAVSSSCRAALLADAAGATAAGSTSGISTLVMLKDLGQHVMLCGAFEKDRSLMQEKALDGTDLIYRPTNIDRYRIDLVPLYPTLEACPIHHL